MVDKIFDREKFIRQAAEAILTAGDRQVAESYFGWGMISTARVTDGYKPYETAIRHEGYKRVGDGETEALIVVEAYDTRELAFDGHSRWVTRMGVPLEQQPLELRDVVNCPIASMLELFGGEDSITFRKRS